MSNLELLTLPEEIRYLILQNPCFSILDILNISLVSTEFCHSIRSCVTSIDEDIPKKIKPNFIGLFPNLVKIKPAITITTVDDLQRIATHPKLRKITLDMVPFCEDFIKYYNEKSYVKDGIAQQYDPIIVPASWKEDKKIILMTITEVVLYFLFMYYHNHKTKLLDTHFTFLLQDLKVIYSPGSIYFSSQGIYLSTLCILDVPFWCTTYFLLQIKEIDHITKYIGPIELSVVNNFEEMALCLDPMLEDDSREFSDAICQALHEILIGTTNLRRLGLYITSKDQRLHKRFSNSGFLWFLKEKNIVAPHVEVFDCPVYIFQLPLIRKIFPNVKEPLIQGFSHPIKDYKQTFDSLIGQFTSYRLLPNISCPQELIDNYPIRVDYDNYYSTYSL